jgi:hypothetical protein
MRRVPLFSLVLVLLFAGAFWFRVGRRPPVVESLSVTPPCDSARAARIVIDSLTRIDPFRSTVFRFGRDSLGVRIVTIPASPSTVRDGMAVVRVNRRCRITSLVQRDSA